jgi:hypothetical protein
MRKRGEQAFGPGGSAVPVGAPVSVVGTGGATMIETFASARLERGDGVRSYLEAFAPGCDWNDLVRWLPDAFALANLVLDRTKAYRFVVAPPPGKNWPPRSNWNGAIEAAARAWREACGVSGGELPPLVLESWQTISRLCDVALSEIASGEAWDLIAALLTLHAAGDEACSQVAGGAASAPGSFEQRAWSLFEQHGSLARLSSRRVRIVPKTNFSSRGVTIRSLSRYLGLSYETVPINWTDSGDGADNAPAGRGEYAILLLPWPLQVKASDFRPYTSRRLGNMDSERFGFFAFAPEAALDTKLVGSLLAEAVQAAGRVDAVVLPEAAVRHSEIAVLERALADRGVGLLIAGVGGARSARSRTQRPALRSPYDGGLGAIPAAQTSSLVLGRRTDPPVPPVPLSRPAQAVVGGDRAVRTGAERHLARRRDHRDRARLRGSRLARRVGRARA